MAAAALIPIATQVVPLLFPLVAKLMDKIFGNGTGPTKLATGTAVVQPIMAALQKALEGTGVSLPVDPKEIQALLQSTVDDLNKKGQLLGTATAIDSAAPAVPKELPLMLIQAAAGLLKTQA